MHAFREAKAVTFDARDIAYYDATYEIEISLHFVSTNESLSWFDVVKYNIEVQAHWYVWSMLSFAYTQIATIGTR